MVKASHSFWAHLCICTVGSYALCSGSVPVILIGPHFEKKKTAETPTLTFSALTTGLDSRIQMPPSLIQDLLFNWLVQNCIPHTHCLWSAWKIVPRLPDNCSEYPFQAADCQNFLREHPHTPQNIILITVSWTSSKLFPGSYLNMLWDQGDCDSDPAHCTYFGAKIHPPFR